MNNHSAARPRMVPLTSVLMHLAKVTLHTRDLAVSRMSLRESMGEPQEPSYQSMLRDWFGSAECVRALAACGLPNNEDVLETLKGCERWPQEVWTTDYDVLPERFQVDLYRLTVVPVAART